MNRAEALSLVKPHLTEKRYEHTIRVLNTALTLAERYGVSKKQTELAAIFHDYAKYRPLKELKHWIETTYLPKDLLQFHHELWHGPVGSILIEFEHGIKDEEVKTAIYYHTTGRKDMTPIELIIYVADYIEPGRNFPGLDDVRNMAERDILKAAWMISRNTINFLMSKNQPIYPDTFHAYNDLTKKVYGGC
ncbi:putative HD superfamily hydrolase involved in NAD metabolism [Cerasibacillus quisquiliarum]|uniref:bis(5'-nucleosyl)-tetraphosphatase (symmetrical) n=1 Tax=Cerasibacillus quisquiliarum TaxID=227865 RepID=A0A511UWQ4_9BACI|nr:bis(5'-nucleosyl)-tetraphosphatase (symmetrical) YqeK [Cerasibacillus quisquiliarum]MBB5145567.1 putative HD superfamily hydrolase involved in NAD metabolism [Cerasibacillus quisquiliarum]GEN31037.1 hypothetical protein CQU01_12750 [Cerasibacillus quisquiliarum]